ncbi:MAG: type IV pilin N-terminal domain-containing protein [Candidatus Methanoperedens sp.]|nr:type IV pilin N-terminal domain-containing protein [Candidatus Methanoperedens sp.]
MRSKNKMAFNKKITEDEIAVSAVVGVILMVAITVIMAAIVASWSSGIKAPTTPTTVGMDIERNTQNITIVITSIDPPSAAPIPSINFTYQNSTTEYVYLLSNSGVYTNSSGLFTNADVGNSNTIVTNGTTPRLLILTATYKDGSKKVLYSQAT